MASSNVFWQFHLAYHHHHYQSINRKGRWGTTDDFTVSFLHFSLFSTAFWDLPNFRPVHESCLYMNWFVDQPSRGHFVKHIRTVHLSEGYYKVGLRLLCWPHVNLVLVATGRVELQSHTCTVLFEWWKKQQFRISVASSSSFSLLRYTS